MPNEQKQPSVNRGARNILESSNALRWLLKLCGLTCFSIQPYTRVVTVTFVDALLFALTFVIVSVLLVIDQRAKGPLEHIQRVGLNLLFRFSYLVVWLNVLLGFIIRNRIAAILIGIHQTDKQLRECGVIVPHAWHGRVMFGFVVGLCIVLVVMPTSFATVLGATYDMPLRALTTSTLNSWYAAICSAAVSAAYSFSLLALQQRIFLLNQSISNMLTQSPPNINDIDNCTELRLEREHTIRQQRKIYAHLTDISDECNICFAAPVMALSAATFGYLLFLMFVVYTISVYETETVLWLPMCWNIYYVSLLVMVVHVGSRLSQTGRQTGACVHAIVNKLCWTSDRTLIQELLQFSHLVLDRAPVASCGLFLFDWSLVYSVFESLIVNANITNTIHILGFR